MLKLISSWIRILFHVQTINWKWGEKGDNEKEWRITEEDQIDERTLVKNIELIEETKKKTVSWKWETEIDSRGVKERGWESERRVWEIAEESGPRSWEIREAGDRETEIDALRSDPIEWVGEDETRRDEDITSSID